MPELTAVTRWRGLRDAFYDTERREFLVLFRDGRMYRLPRSSVPGDDGTDVVGVRVERDGSAFDVQLHSGKHLEVPWDFVLYQLEPAYAYYKGQPVQERLEEDIAVTIGRQVRELRRARGLTTYDLAERSGIHRPNISRIESGRHAPTVDTIERLARALGVTLPDLIGGGVVSLDLLGEGGHRYKTRGQKPTSHLSPTARPRRRSAR